MRTIYKYTLPVVGVSKAISTHRLARIVKVDNQFGEITLWFDLETDNAKETRWFVVCGTGRLIPDNAAYVGTAKINDDVWHVFELEQEGSNEA